MEINDSVTGKIFVEYVLKHQEGCFLKNWGFLAGTKYECRSF
ncbi:hypothetical protein NTGBS_70047 [Candidatus Nitrotoga sp. BS]|nr:hypothetical protein NTGBS_70047 [Candidatus Nitrotoga sp. BS]